MNMHANMPADDEIGRAMELHRRGAALYEARAFEARRAGRAAVAALDAERHTLTLDYETAMAAIAAGIASAEAESAAAAATADRLAETHRAALKVMLP